MEIVWKKSEQVVAELTVDKTNLSEENTKLRNELEAAEGQATEASSGLNSKLEEIKNELEKMKNINSQQTNEVNSIRQANINLKEAKATLGTVN